MKECFYTSFNAFYEYFEYPTIFQRRILRVIDFLSSCCLVPNYENIPFRLTNISDSFHSFGCIIKWFWESIRETLKKEIKVEKDEATQIIATSNDLQAREKDSCVLP